MNSITILCICLASLPMLINANFAAILNQWAKSGQAINGVFYPALNGSLGSGTFSYSWKGTINRLDVAMKFTSIEHQHQAANEYKMYWYLNAVNNNNNNTDIEAYGIPKVYYFGRWGSYYMLAITLLEPYFNQKSRAGEITVVDILIIIREFVRISKYIHSRGVYHEDIKRDNIMFRGHKGFIIDFNKASEVYVFSRSAQHLSPEDIQDGIREAKGDWIRFLPTMCSFIGVKFNFINYHNDSNELLDVEHIRRNIHNALITLEQIPDERLRNVYLEFAKHSFDEDIAELKKNVARKYAVNNRRPFYDQLYHLINMEIDKSIPHNEAVVSWLDERTKRDAQRMMQRQGLPDISSIHVPFQENEREYPKPNYGYFTGQSSR